MPKKICFVTNYHPKYNIGGAEVQCYYLASEFGRRGWDVSYVTFTSGNNHSGFDSENFRLIKIRRKTFIDAILKIITTLFKLKPDVIYCRLVCEGFIAASIYKKKFNAVMLWCPGHDMYCHKKSLYDHLMSTNQGLVSRLKNYVFYFGTLDAIRSTDITFAQNQFQYESLCSQKKGSHIYKMWNAHPVPPEFSLTRIKMALWVSNFNLRKRFPLFCELSRKISTELNYIACGRIPDIPDVSRQARQFINKNPQIDYRGEIGLEDVNNLLCHAMVLVHTSEAEGFPNVMIQSWLRGTPVLTFGIDPDNLIRNHGLGWVCGSVNEARHIIERLCSDQEYACEVMKRCRDFAVKHFSLERAVDKIIAALPDSAST